MLSSLRVFDPICPTRTAPVVSTMDLFFLFLWSSGLTAPFSNPIPLWVVRHYKLPLDPCFFAKGIKLLGGLLSFIIRYRYLHLLTFLVLHKSFSLLEPAMDLILGLNKRNPGFPRSIINERIVIDMTCQQS